MSTFWVINSNCIIYHNKEYKSKCLEPTNLNDGIKDVSFKSFKGTGVNNLKRSFLAHLNIINFGILTEQVLSNVNVLVFSKQNTFIFFSRSI